MKATVFRVALASLMVYLSGCAGADKADVDALSIQVEKSDQLYETIKHYVVRITPPGEVGDEMYAAIYRQAMGVLRPIMERSDRLRTELRAIRDRLAK